MSTVATKLPPGPNSFIPVINLISLRRDPLGFLTRLAKEYGEIAFFKLGPQPVYLISNPEYIRDILITHNKNFMKGEGLQRAKRLLGEGLLTSEGEYHLRQRRLVQPAFHRQRIAGYASTMIDYAARLRDKWNGGEALDISREMMRHTESSPAERTRSSAELTSETA